jgi:hypothetical protein
MEVEQRIGRLDRIGQHADRIQIFNFWTLDTIEERILRRLYDRIGIFERSIIGEILHDLDAVMLEPGLSGEQRENEADRIAKVIEAKRQQLDELEERATAFVGVDAFFDEEVEGIRRGRRYVTGEQLLRFLEDYLLHRAPGTRFRYDRDKSRGLLIPDESLRRLIQQHDRARDLLRLMGAGSEGLAFTVDADVAFEEPSIEFVNVLHPLMEIIRSDYEEELRGRVSAQHVALRTQQLEPGNYVFVVYRLRVEGARTLNFLEAILLDEKLHEACDRLTAEEIIGEMTELGEEPPSGTLALEPEFAVAAGQRAEELFLERLQAIRKELEASNAALVDRRITSIRSHLERQLTRRRELLRKQVDEGRPERILQLTRGQITKLEGELTRQLRELQDHRQIQVGYDEVAAGILEVIS